MTCTTIPTIAMVSNGTAPSASLVARIRNSYRIALQKAPIPTDSVLWSHIIAGKQADIHAALMSDDEAALMALLSNPQATNLYYGVDNLAKDVMAGVSEEEWRAGASVLPGHLNELLAAIGDTTNFNPEGGARFPDKSQPQAKSPEDAIKALDTHFSGQLSFPNPFAGEYGISTSRGVISLRTIQAMYQAIFASRYAASTCVEIGGGMGRTAFFGRKLGLQYTIIDLPMTIVGQALFLGSVLGEDAIWLLGDTAPRGDRIALLPPSELSTIKPVDVVLNVDSMTEMGEQTAADYLRWISANCKTFLSINHEANEFTVKDLCQKIFPNRLRSRSPYWLRAGYVEETFSFESVTLAQIYASKSWRLTAPLRSLARKMS